MGEHLEITTYFSDIRNKILIIQSELPKTEATYKQYLKPEHILHTYNNWVTVRFIDFIN